MKPAAARSSLTSKPTLGKQPPQPRRRRLELDQRAERVEEHGARHEIQCQLAYWAVNSPSPMADTATTRSVDPPLLAHDASHMKTGNSTRDEARQRHQRLRRDREGQRQQRARRPPRPRTPRGKPPEHAHACHHREHERREQHHVDGGDPERVARRLVEVDRRARPRRELAHAVERRHEPVPGAGERHREVARPRLLHVEEAQRVALHEPEPGGVRRDPERREQEPGGVARPRRGRDPHQIITSGSISRSSPALRVAEASPAHAPAHAQRPVRAA